MKNLRGVQNLTNFLGSSACSDPCPACVRIYLTLCFIGTNVCKINNGGCEQLCLFRGNGNRTCACAHGMLAEDGRSCRDYDGYLLYSERTILKSIHLSDETNLNAPIKPFEDPEHMKNVIALTFDYRGGGGKGANRIFYSDIHFGNIQQISDDGSERKTIIESKCEKNWENVITAPADMH